MDSRGKYYVQPYLRDLYDRQTTNPGPQDSVGEIICGCSSPVGMQVVDLTHVHLEQATRHTKPDTVSSLWSLTQVARQVQFLNRQRFRADRIVGQKDVRKRDYLGHHALPKPNHVWNTGGRGAAYAERLAEKNGLLSWQMVSRYIGTEEMGQSPYYNFIVRYRKLGETQLPYRTKNKQLWLHQCDGNKFKKLQVGNSSTVSRAPKSGCACVCKAP